MKRSEKSILQTVAGLFRDEIGPSSEYRRRVGSAWSDEEELVCFLFFIIHFFLLYEWTFFFFLLLHRAYLGFVSGVLYLA